MSAGTGIQHAEYNHSESRPSNILQIWLFPKVRNIQPRYDQKSFARLMKMNEFTTLVSPDKGTDALWINQDATFSMGQFEAGQRIEYQVRLPGNGLYLFVVDGAAEINNTAVNKRDALGVYDVSSITIETEVQSRLLVMDVPML